ncbi:cupredoxin domain-containing protein [Bacillus sp. CGMCC 1.16541]|uniref:cupredoxin domain-containing protein n=1 Tax=Bacillus sp. CGMCC 1.16541 TaxID=2185143 RepID=UPI000D72964E|nr:cupredoxin domain-containing protein [Bacillus sp. CGMCC 1.16541]
MKFVVIKRKWLTLLALVLTVGCVSWYVSDTDVALTNTQPNQQKLVINLVTGEFSSKTEDGQEIESYRWDPGTIMIPKGEEVALSIYGVNGKEHPFFIEGTDYKGVVKKGEETVLQVTFDKPGIYRLICTTHARIEDNGPMIAYLIVD